MYKPRAQATARAEKDAIVEAAKERELVRQAARRKWIGEWAGLILRRPDRNAVSAIP